MTELRYYFNTSVEALAEFQRSQCIINPKDVAGIKLLLGPLKLPMALIGKRSKFKDII